MRQYRLCSNSNTAKNIRNRELVKIKKEDWLDYITNHKDFSWYIDTALGQLDKNHKKHPLDPMLYYARAYYKLDEKKGYSNVVIEFPLQHCKYIVFQFPRTTINILQMMWSMSKALNCHLVKGSTIVTDKRYEKLIEKYTPKKS